MQVDEAKQYIGRNVSVTFIDRQGDIKTKNTRLLDISYEAMYGTYIVGEEEEFILEKIISIDPIEEIDSYI